MDFSGRTNLFSINKITIPTTAKVVWVADMFVEDYQGGAEMTSESLIKASPFEVFKLHSKDVTMELLEAGVEKYWIFSNFSAMDYKLIPSIVANMKYSVVEYDYKFCKYRSMGRHFEAERKQCDCDNDIFGKLVSTFFYQARSLWWMAEGQQEIYFQRFPFLKEKKSTVLSSVFDDETFVLLKTLREKYKDNKSNKWIVLDSPSWIKGAQEAKLYCEENNLEYESVWGLSYPQLLEKIAQSKGLVYLPKDNDTCPRLVLETKLLGKELVINDFVQNKNEEWFTGTKLEHDGFEDSEDEITRIEQYLYASREIFWNGIRADMEYKPKISGYTHIQNPTQQGYPWKESIISLLGCTDEVVVMDGGSTDGSWEELNKLAESDDRVKPFQIKRDWNDKRFALFDGQQKAEARKRCTGDFLIQLDCDEIIHEDDYEKYRKLAEIFPKEFDLVAMPVVEFWGNEGKVRVDVNPWKQRMSRNNSRITHGIPDDHRKFDENGELYSAGSDGCCYIYSDSFKRVPFATFWTYEFENLRMHALNKNLEALSKYEELMNQVAKNLPGVFHYSWFDLTRKIYTYKNYWTKHWNSLFDKNQEDTPENNMFFDKSWSDVSDEEIKVLSDKMKNEIGGWIFHKKLDFSNPTPSIRISKEHPKVITDWVSKIE